MRPWLCAVALWLAIVCPTRADDSKAKERFDAGVAAASQDKWQEAALLFEESLAEADKPATRFNLVLAYHELHRPFDTARHAFAFLAQPSGVEREAVRGEVTEALNEAIRALAVLDTTALPKDAKLRIDGDAPAVVDGARVYVSPGLHQLELALAGDSTESVDVTLAAGQTLSWPRAARAVDVNAVPSPPAVVARAIEAPIELTKGAALRAPAAVLRARIAWSSGVVGAAATIAAAACLWATDQRADELARGGVSGTQAPGYYDASRRYWRTFDAVIPLALAGGALMAAAVVVAPRLSKRGSLAWSVASLVLGGGMLGVGIFQLVHEPSEVIFSAPLERPSRQVGSLLVAISLPLLAHGLVWAAKRKARTDLGSSWRVRVTWSIGS